MEFWVNKLREQAAAIADGNYASSAANFARAPAEIAGLSGDLDRLAQTNAEREAVRKTLALEVHHRVKNNLQIVTSLLNMQANRIENPAAREALGQTRARIGALALIHRVLYEQADDGSQATLDFARLVTELCAQFRIWNSNRPEIAFSCKASPYAAPLDSAMPLVLFAVEAVTNAYSYAFPEQRSGSVMLSFAVSDSGDAAFCVKDDGAGFDSNRNGNSMGRQLMHGFAQQLGARLTIESSAGGGTEVRLDYRIAT